MSLLALVVTGTAFGGPRPTAAQSSAAPPPESDRATAIDELARAYHSLRRFNGTLLVADSGRVIYRGAFGHADLEAGRANEVGTRFPIGSLAEQLTAALALRLAEAGLVRLGEPAAENLSDPAVVERVTGEPYLEALRERLLDPLGMADTRAQEAWPGPDQYPPGHALGHERTLIGYRPVREPFPPLVASSTVDDLFRWTRALLGGKVLGDPASLERMVGPRADGYGWRVERRDGAGVSETLYQCDGALPGFTSAWRHLPETDATIIVLDNTASSPAAMLDGITALLRGREPELPKPSIAERILPVVEAAGVDAGLQRYMDRLRFRPDDYDFGPGELAALGDHFLERGDMEEAIRLHAANVERHPDHPLPYRESAEAHLVAGDTALAVALFEDALMRAPGAPGVLRRLRALGAEVEPALAMAVRPIAPEALARYIGVYQIEPGVELEVVHEAEGLTARRSGGPAFPLLPQAEGVFLMHGSRIQLLFTAPGAGPHDVATAVTVIESGQRVTFPRVR